MRFAGSRRDTLDRCAKRTKRAHPSLTWRQARREALVWCIAMWPDFVVTRKAVRL